MIEKLDIIRDSENCVDTFGYTHNVAGNKVISKINELIDAVNELQNMQVQVNDHEIRLTALDDPTGLTPADPYTEQRKWIGKLCKFYKNGEMVTIDILRAVAEKGTFFPFRSTKDWYEHCKPVSPDDDIIYKKD